jgi:hypothetical protein
MKKLKWFRWGSLGSVPILLGSFGIIIGITMASYTLFSGRAAGGQMAIMAILISSGITPGMVPGGITGTGGIQPTGTISIDIIIMVSVGIMAIGAMMPGEIIGDLGIMVAIWSVAIMAVMAVVLVQAFIPDRAAMAGKVVVPDKAPMAGKVVVPDKAPMAGKLVAPGKASMAGKLVAPGKASMAGKAFALVRASAPVRVVAAAM